MNIAEKYMTDMELNEPSNPLEINKTEDKLKIKFPEQYKKFLLSHNGAEGSIGENSYLVIWSIEDIISLNEEYGVFEFTPEILYFSIISAASDSKLVGIWHMHLIGEIQQ